jgi:TIR domain-containing protein
VIPVSSKIFISYRRDDASGYAGRIYDRLNARLPNSIFIDVSKIKPGADFVKTIEEAVGACDTLLVLMGKHWLEGRLDDSNDFVRLEIATALKRNIRVLPVLLRGAVMPTSQELPADIAPLAHRHALEITDDDFDHDIQRLVKIIQPSSRTRKMTRAAMAAALLLAVTAVTFWFFNRETPPSLKPTPTPPPRTLSPTPVPPSDILLPFDGPRPAAKDEVIGQPASAEVCAAIRKSYDRISEAIAKKDIQAYKAVYSADFVCRDDANVKSFERFFSELETVFPMFLAASYDIQKVVITAPGTAVVTVKSDVKTVLTHAIETDRDTWKHIGDQWLCTELNVLEGHMKLLQDPFHNF